MSDVGLTPEDFAVVPPFEVWPENETALRVFLAMDTQWQIGPGGPVGLIYSSLAEVWQRQRVPDEERDEVFEGLRVLEEETLLVVREQRAAAEAIAKKQRG